MPEPATADDPVGIFAWLSLDHRLTTSGKLIVPQLHELKVLDVGHVINLAPDAHDQALRDEAGLLSELGMGYTYIPVSFDDPDEADFRRFSAKMDELSGQAVHVHCIANLRVSAFLYRYRKDVLAWPAANARVDLEKIWRPGGAWAEFIGDPSGIGDEHRYAGRDYTP